MYFGYQPLSKCLTSRYTAKFDKVKLDKVVENVAELPDPEVRLTYLMEHSHKSFSSCKIGNFAFLYETCGRPSRL